MIATKFRFMLQAMRELPTLILMLVILNRKINAIIKNDAIIVMGNKKYRCSGVGGFLWSKVLTMVQTVLHKIYPCHLPVLISPITSPGTW